MARNLLIILMMGKLKSISILILALMTALLFYRGKKLERTTTTVSNQIGYQQQVEPIPSTQTAPSPQLLQTPSPFSARASTEALISQERANLSALVKDKNNLKLQIRDANPAAIDQQIKSVQQDITGLQNQLNYYRNSTASTNQTASQQLVYLEKLTRQIQTRLSDEIQAIEREMRAARYSLNDANLNSDMNQPGKADAIQQRIQELKDQLDSLQAQKIQVASQALDQIDQIRTQSADSSSNVASIQRAITYQIDVLQSNLTYLQSAKDRAQSILDFLNQEISDRLQRQKDIEARLEELNTELKSE